MSGFSYSCLWYLSTLLYIIKSRILTAVQHSCDHIKMYLFFLLLISNLGSITNGDAMDILLHDFFVMISTFFLDIYLELEFLNYRVYKCSALLDTAKQYFPNYLY